MKSLDTVAVGTCYLDTNVSDYPFKSSGIPSDTELVGGEYQVVAGGSAVNFCRLLGSLGLHTAFIGMAGRDSNGDALASHLQKEGVEPLLIRRDDLLTNISFNMTNPEGEHIMLVAGNANASLEPQFVLKQLETVMGKAKTLYVGGCFKLKNLAPAFASMAETAKKHGAAVVIDHGRIPETADSTIKGAVKSLVRAADYYLPSQDEFCQLWEASTIEEGLKKLHAEHPSLQVIVKDGAAGAWYWDAGSIRQASAPTVDKVIQATGAGDSFNAGVITALLQGASKPDAAAYGCLVASAKIAGRPIPLYS